MRSLALRVVIVVASLALVACGGDKKDGGLLSGGGAKAPTEPAATSRPSTPSAGPTTAARTPTPRADREDWQTAMLDDSKSLPGEYVAPHPGSWPLRGCS